MRTRTPTTPARNFCCNGSAILRFQELVRKVPVSPFVVSYAVALAQRSRPQSADALQYVKDYVEWGAGPRASQYLILGAKARAVLHGRFAASVEDVQALAKSVLRHRIISNFAAEAERITSLQIIDRLLAEIQPEHP